VFVVRHAEKTDDTAQALLSAVGHARAQALARWLRDAGVSAVYTSEVARTRQTAEPLCALRGIKPTVWPAADPTGLVAHMQKEHKGDVVTIVGHSNTVPLLLRALGVAPPITIAPDEYDNLFVVVPRKEGPPVLLRLRY
jgi:broad specificity phosphatase PhoE